MKVMQFKAMVLVGIKVKFLGFELENGKKGLIKLITAPTGNKDENGIVSVGKIVFDIKMER